MYAQQSSFRPRSSSQTSRLTSGNFEIEPVRVLEHVPAASESPSNKSAISRKRKRHTVSLQDDYQPENYSTLPVETVRKYTLYLISQIFSGTAIGMGVLWEIFVKLLPRTGKEDQDQDQDENMRQLKRSKLEEKINEIETTPPPIKFKNVFSETPYDEISLEGVTANNTTIAPAAIPFNLSGTSTPFTEKKTPRRSSFFQSPESDIGSEFVTPYPLPKSEQHENHVSKPVSFPTSVLRSLFADKSARIDNEVHEAVQETATAVNKETEQRRDAANTIGNANGRPKAQETLIPLNDENLEPHKGSGKLRSGSRTFSLSKARIASFASDRLSPFSNDGVSFLSKGHSRSYSRDTPLGRLAAAEPVRASPGFNDTKSSTVIPSVTYGTTFLLKRASRSRISSFSRSAEAGTPSRRDLGHIITTKPLADEPNGYQNKSELKRRKSVGEQFREALKSGHIKDVNRSTGESTGNRSGFPLSYQDQEFYREAFARAQRMDAKSRFVYEAHGTDIELPGKSTPGSYKKYESLHQSRLKLADELKKLKAGSQKIAIEPLSTTSIEYVDQYLSKSRSQDNQVVGSGFKVDVRLRDLKTLLPGTWLNDTVIDFYIALVTDEASRSGESHSFGFSTHFFTTLTSSKGYNGVARWAKRKGADVTKMDCIFVPINQNDTHWCLAVINNKDRRFEFYNSLPSSGAQALDILEDYMVQESTRLYPDQKEKFQVKYSSYSKEASVQCPGQSNMYDCGVFCCTNVFLLSHNRPLAYSQNEMPLMRKKIAYSILTYGHAQAKI